jgi:hypothetical protein
LVRQFNDPWKNLCSANDPASRRPSNDSCDHEKLGDVIAPVASLPDTYYASKMALGQPRGAVAQMGERCNRTAEVRSSILLGSTSAGKQQRRGILARIEQPIIWRPSVDAGIDAAAEQESGGR